MRFPVKAVAAVIVCGLVVLALFLVQPDEKEKVPASAASPSPLSQGTSQAPEASSAPAEAPEEVLEFIAAYGSPEGSDADWSESLAPSSTPALHASIASSDRELARSAGTEVLAVDGTHVTVGTAEGHSTYTLTMAPRPEGHEHSAEEGHEEAEGEWLVVAIDYLDPPQVAALPLGEGAVEDLRPTLQDALTVVVAQPGGQTLETREERIRDVFTDPVEALEIPPAGPEGQSVRIGNAHEIVLAAEDEELVAYVTVPYAPDGEDTPSWVTVTISLERTDAGDWVPTDAHS